MEIRWEGWNLIGKYSIASRGEHRVLCCSGVGEGQSTDSREKSF